MAKEEVGGKRGNATVCKKVKGWKEMATGCIVLIFNWGCVLQMSQQGAKDKLGKRDATVCEKKTSNCVLKRDATGCEGMEESKCVPKLICNCVHVKQRL